MNWNTNKKNRNFFFGVRKRKTEKLQLCTLITARGLIGNFNAETSEKCIGIDHRSFGTPWRISDKRICNAIN